jgi:shikimate dehydrogenase
MITLEPIIISDFLSNKADSGSFLAVLGRPIAHSLSPLIHNYALRKINSKAEYFPILVPSSDESVLHDLIRHPNFRGANVTLPLKQIVGGMVDQNSQEVLITGAANTIYRQHNGDLTAANTDIEGFLAPLTDYSEHLNNSPAIIFGSGGASKAVVYALKLLGMNTLFVVSRNPNQLNWEDCTAISYSDWPDVAKTASLVVNTSPLGMYPNVNDSPVEDQFTPLLENKICYDLVYRPIETRFLNQARLANGIVINGLEMFIGQAAGAFKLFTGNSFPVDEVRNLLQEHFKHEAIGH